MESLGIVGEDLAVFNAIVVIHVGRTPYWYGHSQCKRAERMCQANVQSKGAEQICKASVQIDVRSKGAAQMCKANVQSDGQSKVRSSAQSQCATHVCRTMCRAMCRAMCTANMHRKCAKQMRSLARSSCSQRPMCQRRSRLCRSAAPIRVVPIRSMATSTTASSECSSAPLRRSAIVISFVSCAVRARVRLRLRRSARSHFLVARPLCVCAPCALRMIRYNPIIFRYPCRANPCCAESRTQATRSQCDWRR